ncbi:MAG: ABC transporter ATP-binding protein [Spirochaetota bacterium]
MSETDVIIAIHGLTKRFGGLTAVDSLSLTIRRGEIFGLLGPNGAGKTTTINMLCGLQRPSSGSFELRPDPASKPGGAELAIGLCPQAIVVWETLTCLEQLVFLAEMYDVRSSVAKKRALALLEAMGLMEKKDRLAKTLSGGMQRRLNIILALVHEPAIVVLDEPQAGLDPQSRVLVRDYIRSRKSDTTVILTTHDMEEADKLSDRVAIMDRGKLLVLDTPRALKQAGGQEELLELALGEEAAGRAAGLVGRLSGGGMTVTRKDGLLLIAVEDALGGMERVVRAAREEGMEIEDLRIRRRTLEDVFIGLTGRGLRE